MLKFGLALLISLMGFHAHAGWLGDLLDGRLPVEKCQDYISKEFSSSAQLLATCAEINTAPAYKCLRAVGERSDRMSVLRMRTCGLIHEEVTFQALNAVLNKFTINDDGLLAVTFADQPGEAACISGLAQHAASIALDDLLKCSSEGTFSFYRRKIELSF